MGKRKGNEKVSVASKMQAERKKPAGEQKADAAVNWTDKDTVFRMLFREKERLLALYNAVSGKHYTVPEELEIVTLENAIYMSIKNDLAFLIDCSLHLYEHQSTINKNMPYRFLQYVAAEYERLTVRENLYREKLVKIPTPHFVVFYNGTRTYPERQVIKLSDAFQVQESNPELELCVQVFNINKDFNADMKEQCRTLAEYMQYVDKVRTYAKAMPMAEAVDRAVDECIEQDILREFLLQNKAEVKRMSIYEYDEEDTRRAIREDAFEEGDFYRVVSLVCKKLRKGKTLEETAEELEEEISVIGPIYDTAKEFAPEYDPNLIFEKLNK